MKAWPEDDRPADFDNLVEPLLEATKTGYRVVRLVRVKSIPYDGYELGAREQKHYGSVEGMLSEDSIRAEDREGRSLLETLISIAVLLGVEQGRRIERLTQGHTSMDLAPKPQSKTLEG